ncbi:MAG: amidohydrolase [Sphingobacteriia bacterium]|nr:amidohydrolase [Sphingobacteriia bacterium]
MQDLTVALVQSSLIWENTEANLALFDEKLSGLKTDTHLILLPEMFNTGFSMNPVKIAETPNGRSFTWLKQKSREFDCVISGSILTEVDGKYYNRLYWMHPDGKFDYYDKHHLFRMGEEHQVFTAGMQRPLFLVKGWKIFPFICYDLRFPVWMKNRFQNETYNYDLIVGVANWPAVRQNAWKQLLVARSVENQAYLAAVNRVGEDGNGHFHAGDSCIIDPLGQIIGQTDSGKENIITATLSYKMLQDYRRQFPVGCDWDEFILKGFSD